tara:strand:+ start:338 stop:1276 length:939 start_codon:yes stop_codon:yes gene_type:complete
MSLKDYKKVKNIASLGGGPIGGGWSAFFLSQGYNVKAYLHDKKETEQFAKIIDTAWISLKELGTNNSGKKSNLTISHDLSDCLKDVDFVQESAPENLSLKQELYKDIGDILPSNIVIASSTSGLMMSDIQMKCSTPERTVVGHPFNPPYLLPLVEIVGGKKTEDKYVKWLYNFYQFSGKAPLILKKEIPGFIATRLQEALWREALHMVDNNEASPEDIDKALINGPAARMAVQGQCMAFHVACGEGGMATNLDQFGPALKLPWTRLKAPKLTKELRNKMVDGCYKMSKNKSFKKLAADRDAKIVEIIKTIQN